MNDFSQSLKTWRKERRFSQLELAMEANISSRHLSFLETGRANPSPDMIMKLGDALQLPLAARNQMLTHAGFAARYPGRKWNAEEMTPIRAAIEYTLRAHAPYPAIALDRLWNILEMNKPAEALFGALQITKGGSILDLIVSEEVQAVIENWPEVAHHTVQRLRTESAAQGGVEELDRVANLLAETPVPEKQKTGPVVPTIFRLGDLRLSLFGTIAQFGTPEDLTLDDLKIELFFPADEATEQGLKGMAG
jgi:transcriptional regulator with XRE-family HTH domain